MKKVIFLLIASVGFIINSHAQSPGKGGKQLNAGVGFSNFGVPIYLGLDFGVSDDITVGPQVSYRNHSQTISGFKFDQQLIVVSFNGNYHFNNLLDIAEPWDVYGGVTLGYYIWSSDSDFTTGVQASGIGFSAQVGARYFVSDKFGLNLEFGGGTASGGKFGITLKF